MDGRHYSKREVANAGKAIAAYEGAYTELAEEAAILEAWRQAHNRVMIDVKAELAQLVMEKCSSAVVVGRLKRADAIVAKLRRADVKHKLSMLQDIAGCRVIVDTLEELELLSSLIIEHQSPFARWGWNPAPRPRLSGVLGIELPVPERFRG